MPLHAIDDFLPWCSFQSLFVCGADGFDGAGQERRVSCKESGVIRPVMMVPPRDVVKTIDGIGARDMLFPKVRSSVGQFCLPLENFERPVGLIAREARC